ncbi:uncharacterized protein LOC103512788, partial [Diaphorina citri]
MRWTYEHNKYLLYAYYKSTEVDSNKKNYLLRLERLWISQYPSLEFNGNKLAGQVRSILKRQIFTSHQIESIKDKVRHELTTVTTPEPIDHSNTPSNNTSSSVDLVEQQNHVSDIIDLNDSVIPQPDRNNDLDENRQAEIVAKFDSLVQQFENVEINRKPIIPKIPYNNFSLLSVAQVNEVLESRFKSSVNISQTHNFIYCAAMTVCFLLHIKINQNESTNHAKINKEPPWKMRLENKIKYLRSKIGILTHYFKNNCQVPHKIKTKIKQIAYEYNIKFWTPDYNEKMKIQLEMLKQKAAALGYRIRKYNKRKKRYEQNKSFRINQKKFYESINEKKVSEFTTLPAPDSLYNFWNQIWGHENIHNHDAPWIDEEVKRMQDLPTMETLRISTSDVSNAAKYLKSWKSTGPDQLHNYWLKMFTNCHSVLAKQYQECLQNPSLLPESFTKGVTYMIPKNKNTHDPGNFRPITCLPTMYKLLSSIIKTKIYQHVRENHILAEEQNGIRKKARGSKELLVLDSIVTKHAKLKKRNLS